MTNQPQRFRHHDVVKAFRAATAAGVANPTVRVSLPNGTTLDIGGGPGKLPRDMAPPKPAKSAKSPPAASRSARPVR
jgi:hypothetical protein